LLQITKIQSFQLVETNEIGEVRKDPESGQLAIFTNRKINAEETVSRFGAREEKKAPTYLTIQLDASHHILLKPLFLQYINHSCYPNCFFDTKKLEVIALREIKKGEELTVFYPATEWEMNQPFVCNCNNPECLGVVRGGKHLSEEEASRYRLNQHIVNKRKENF
jgi:hypothetical protein